MSMYVYTQPQKNFYFLWLLVEQVFITTHEFTVKTIRLLHFYFLYKVMLTKN